MTHQYWYITNADEINVIRANPHPRGTLTIEGAAQLRDFVNVCAGAESVAPLVVEIDIESAELEEVRQMAEGRPIKDWAPWVSAIAALDQYPSLVVAAIPRRASCGGLELALAADLRIARHDATLGLFESRMGILPGAGGTQRLPHLVGFGHATELILSGAPISGARAADIGLVEHLDEDPMSRAVAITQACWANGSEVLTTAKRAIRAAATRSEDGYRVEGKSFLHLVNQPTAHKKIAEWLARPELSGRDTTALEVHRTFESERLNEPLRQTPKSTK